MFEDIEANVKDWTDEKEVEAYLRKILNKEAFDHTGLIYGMGPVSYTHLKLSAHFFAEQWYLAVQHL